MLRVMQMHRDAVESIKPECPEYLVTASRKLWDDVLAAGSVHGYRNAQATVLAPTGTITTGNGVAPGVVRMLMSIAGRAGQRFA